MLLELTTEKVDEWLDYLKSNDVGDRAISSTFSTLRTALKHAHKQGYLISNPCALAVSPSYQRKKIHPFTIAEAKRILAATKETDLLAILELGLLVGLRQEEIFGARWQDLNLVEATLQICQVAIDVEGKVYIKTPKTASSLRTVSLPKSTVKHLATLAVEAAAAGRGGEDLIFCTSRGTPRQRSNFGRRKWKPLLAKLGLKHRGFHHARHTAATTMLREGIPAHIVTRQLGHARTSITLDIYAHCLANDTMQASDAMDRIFNG